MFGFTLPEKYWVQFFKKGLNWCFYTNGELFNSIRDFISCNINDCPKFPWSICVPNYLDLRKDFFP